MIRPDRGLLSAIVAGMDSNRAPAPCSQVYPAIRCPIRRRLDRALLRLRRERVAAPGFRLRSALPVLQDGFRSVSWPALLTGIRPCTQKENSAQNYVHARHDKLLGVHTE